jgi:hypothetical protein
MKWREKDYSDEWFDLSTPEVWAYEPIKIDDVKIEIKHCNWMREDAEKVVKAFDKDGHLWSIIVSYGFEEIITTAVIIAGKETASTGWRPTNDDNTWEQDDQGVPPMREVSYTGAEERWTRATIEDFVEACRALLNLI